MLDYTGNTVMRMTSMTTVIIKFFITAKDAQMLLCLVIIIQYCHDTVFYYGKGCTNAFVPLKKVNSNTRNN